MARRGDGIYRRGNTWWLDFRHDGRRHVVRLGKGISRTVARELAQVQRGAALKSEAGIGRKRKDVTFDQAKTEFLKWAEANKRTRTARTYRQCLEALARSFTGRRLSAISAFDVERHKRSRLEAGVRVMVNREIACLGALYNRCREWGKYEGASPIGAVKPVKESEGRLRYLEPDEAEALLEAAREPLRSIILVGIYAGLRIESEALTLRTADVDLRTGVLTVQSAYAKSGKTRHVPMNAPLRSALARLKEQARGEHIFARPDGSPYRSIRTAFQTARRRAGLGSDVTPHVLRHTFASRLVMAGVDLRTVQDLGGWSSLELVQRYSHLSPARKAEAVERIVAGAANFPTGFTTPVPALAGVSSPVSGKLVSLQRPTDHAPVAQVDRAAVS